MSINLTIADLWPVDKKTRYEFIVKSKAPEIADQLGKKTAGEKEFDYACDHLSEIPLGNQYDIIVFPDTIHRGGHRVRVLQQQGRKWVESFLWLNHCPQSHTKVALI